MLSFENRQLLERATLPGENPPSVGELLDAERNPTGATRAVLQYLELNPGWRDLLNALDERWENAR